MKTVRGDLIKMALSDQFDIIVHGCNCFNTMGSGIAKDIKIFFPEAYEIDQTTIKGDESKLGKYSYADIAVNGRVVTVVNAYTQYNYGSKKLIHVDYDAVREVFAELKDEFGGLGKRFGYPKIGCGLAGGKWEIVSEIINEELEGEDHSYVEFEV